MTKMMFYYTPTYFELLFETTAGLTGIMLCVILLFMGVCSLNCVRKRWFQLFAWVHVFGAPLFMLCLVLHGSESWFNWGFPLGIIIVAPIALICAIMYG